MKRRNGPRLREWPETSTPRELEIASLIAGGLSNREIATQLTVSVRTVEGHIYRACIKLDICNRYQLAILIGSRDEIASEQCATCGQYRTG